MFQTISYYLIVFFRKQKELFFLARAVQPFCPEQTFEIRVKLQYKITIEKQGFFLSLNLLFFALADFVKSRRSRRFSKSPGNRNQACEEKDKINGTLNLFLDSSSRVQLAFKNGYLACKKEMTICEISILSNAALKTVLVHSFIHTCVSHLAQISRTNKNRSRVGINTEPVPVSHFCLSG